MLRGKFTAAESLEWCERNLLARIHRYTVNRLRQEIEPVPAAAFMAFLLRWQHAHPQTRLRGRDALAAVLEQLEGFEAAASAWEGDILPARVADYDPAWLDGLCQSGRYIWTRLSSAAGSAPVKTSPVTFLPRKQLGLWRALRGEDGGAELSANAKRLLHTLREHGAQFFEELWEHSDLLKTQAEDAWRNWWRKAGCAATASSGCAHYWFRKTRSAGCASSILYSAWRTRAVGRWRRPRRAA
ncbi:Lhr family ATP-dependent helicase, partial [Methylogaea oryzae]|uniref:Lhr family ATP-dependent helicase n=1 Tax=Methylogaea oryzae TaxID=1295382 RepID=UPI003BB4EAEB